MACRLFVMRLGCCAIRNFSSDSFIGHICQEVQRKDEELEKILNGRYSSVKVKMERQGDCGTCKHKQNICSIKSISLPLKMIIQPSVVAAI